MHSSVIITFFNLQYFDLPNIFWHVYASLRYNSLSYFTRSQQHGWPSHKPERPRSRLADSSDHFDAPHWWNSGHFLSALLLVLAFLPDGPKQTSLLLLHGTGSLQNTGMVSK